MVPLHAIAALICASLSLCVRATDLRDCVGVVLRVVVVHPFKVGVPSQPFSHKHIYHLAGPRWEAAALSLLGEEEEEEDPFPRFML